MIRLIVGLGNPGKSYSKTRHNAGVWFVEKICEAYHSTLRIKTNFQGQSADIPLTDSLSLHVLVPTTFMNHSGIAVGTFLRYYKINPDEMLIVHDELDFEPGTIRLKFGGGAGGHNGLSDIIRVCGTETSWRLRIGIGHPGNKLIVPQYVLGMPRATEWGNIQQAIQRAMTILPDLCTGHAERAMQALHGQLL